MKQGSLQGAVDLLACRHVRRMVKYICSIGSRAPGTVTDRTQREAGSCDNSFFQDVVAYLCASGHQVCACLCSLAAEGSAQIKNTWHCVRAVPKTTCMPGAN